AEAWAIAFRRVGDQRELRDGERGAAGVEERAVELAVVVREDPQPRDAARETVGLGLGVSLRHADEQQQPGPDRTARARGGARDALDDDPHGCQLSGVSRMRAA